MELAAARAGDLGTILVPISISYFGSAFVRESSSRDSTLRHKYVSGKHPGQGTQKWISQLYTQEQYRLV